MINLTEKQARTLVLLTTIFSGLTLFWVTATPTIQTENKQELKQVKLNPDKLLEKRHYLEQERKTHNVVCTENVRMEPPPFDLNRDYIHKLVIDEHAENLGYCTYPVMKEEKQLELYGTKITFQKTTLNN